MLVSIHVGSVQVGEDSFDAIAPKSATFESAGMDISTPYDFVLKAGEKHLLNTGLIIKAPRGFCIQILPRSSLACKRGILIPNSPGLIDRDYCGPEDFIKVMLLNSSSEDVEFKRGDRVAQLLFTPYMTPDWSVVKDASALSGNSRGGFGSTGMR